VSRPAPFGRMVATQAAVEARMTARRGENLLAMIVLPAAALAVFGALGSAGGRSIATLLPGVLALALVASGLVNLGIATAFERGYGVLKRLGGSPLGRDGLIAAKVAIVSVIAVLQVAALLALAITIGWRPGPSASSIEVAIAVLVGSATFSSLGLLVAGTLRAEAALVVANVVFLVALLLAGIPIPLEDLPDPLMTLALASPVGALASAFGASLGGAADYVASLGTVAAWGVVAAILTSRSFRWD
jgi:ABC-2 type transport system permease protein